MAVPITLLDLGATLHPAHDIEHQEQMARLAARLGFIEVWLEGDAGRGWPDQDRIRRLTLAAAPARFGLVEHDVDTLAARLSQPRTDTPMAIELNQHLPSLDRAADQVTPKLARVRLRSFDSAAAGTVVRAATREAAVALVSDAVAARRSAGLTSAEHPVGAVLTVSIGRTMREAETRANLDPRFRGEQHPRVAGLFGTHEQAQEQVLAFASAGADFLRVIVADELDVADLLAQVRSLVVGATPVLHARASRTS